MNTLFIDTRDNKKIIVRFEKDRKIYKKEAVRSPDKAQVALPLIEKIIKNSKASLRDIDEIKVEILKRTATLERNQKIVKRYQPMDNSINSLSGNVWKKLSSITTTW